MLLMGSVSGADDMASAVLERQDGRGLQVFLKRLDATNITIRLDKATADTQLKLEEVKFLNFNHTPYDQQSVEKRFNEADYRGVIDILEPVAAPYSGYASIRNNLEDPFCLLMNAYFENKNFAQSRRLATFLSANQNPEVKSKALVFQALSSLNEGSAAAVSNLLPQIINPSARLYVQACTEHAQKQPKAAIQTAIKLIAEYPNDKEWLPQTELLCAQLYYEMNMTNAAAVTARQVQKFYAGTYVAKEAQILRSKIEK
jgi:hypothetical protein